ncbi:MAG: OB-fold domain-containing protein [Bryobacteraceae bacterium]
MTPTTDTLGSGTVYTETVVWSPPEAFLNDAPYQLAIVSLEAGGRITARIDGARVAIGDAVDFSEHRDGIPYFRKH